MMSQRHEERQLTLAQWQQMITQYYRGYKVKPTSIRDGITDKICWCTPEHLGSTKEEIMENAKRIIDAHLSKLEGTK